MRNKFKDFNKKIIKRDEKIKQIKAKLSQKDEELTHVKKEFTNKDKELTHVKEELTNKDKELTRVKEELANKDKELKINKELVTRITNELNNKDEELTLIKEKLVQKEVEINEINNKLDKSEYVLSLDKQDLTKEFKQAAVVGGSNNYNQLCERPNNKNKKCYQAISPPKMLPFDLSAVNSYSVYSEHSVVVTKCGSLRGIGDNSDGRISNSLPKTQINQLTEFSIKDPDGRNLTSVSAVCLESGTLYMFLDPSPFKHNISNILVYCDCFIKGGKPVFINARSSDPIALFGGCSNAAAICREGEIIFIHRRSVILHPEKEIKAVSLPFNNKASIVACCDDSVVVLSKSGLVFISNIDHENCSLNFSLVLGLDDIKIVHVSGTSAHFLAVSEDGRVFGLGSNLYGQLGLSEKIKSVSSFTEIRSLRGYKIKAAYAGCTHSLFVTEEGKILSCGSNKFGEILLNSGPGKSVYSPTETTINNGAKFCIAGSFISSVFVGVDEPPKMPNKRFIPT